MAYFACHILGIFKEKRDFGPTLYQNSRFNPSSPKGGLYQPPLTVIALVLKIAQPKGKIAPGTFKFILSLHFSVKISNLPPTPGVG